ncbi:MAG: glycerate kinase, partial [Acidobacteria bacterium]|nr:glycerate kinase [Acidobacteriota bacterium]
MRAIARHIFDHALGESSIRRAFSEQVGCDGRVLGISGNLYDFNAYGRVFVVSLGKAAHSMLAALSEQTGERFEGIVSSPIAREYPIPGFRYFHGGHPLPNADSIRAAEAIMESLAAEDERSLVIYLLSGGGSAAVEKPVDDRITLDDLIETYRVLVHSGASITEINALRKHLSAIKGGRLAKTAYPAEQVSILVSDVPDPLPDALASGPTMPDSTTVEDCFRLAAKYNLLEKFPSSVRGLFERHALQETPKSGDPAFSRARWSTILSNSVLVHAAKREAERQGFAVEIDNRCDDWDYERAADYLLERVRQLGRTNARACLLSGGEVTVNVTRAGVGGRNQQFALYCATRIQGESI